MTAADKLNRFMRGLKDTVRVQVALLKTLTSNITGRPYYLVSVTKTKIDWQQHSQQ